MEAIEKILAESGPGPAPKLVPGRKRLPLKTRLIVLAVGLLAAFIWALTFFSATILKGQFEDVLRDQQLASTRRLAVELDVKLRERIESLNRVAATLPPDLGEKGLDAALRQFVTLHAIFSGGITIIGLDGVAIADFPVAPGRRGTYFGDRDYFRRVVQSQHPYIDKPIIGRALKRPVLVISVPVFDEAGKLRAVMNGITDLTAPNFLGLISQPEMSGKGELFVISPHDGLIIAASDASRAMTATPPNGIATVVDRLLDSDEGSGVGVSSQGVPKLYSAVRVPVAKWVVLSALPTEVAFGPVRTMQVYLYALAAIMTLLAVLILRHMTKRLLAPLDEATAAIRRMIGGEAPMQPVPVTRQDEVGELIGNFNLLVEDRQRYETALGESERKLRKLVDSAPEAIVVQTKGRFAYVNDAAVSLFGAASREQLLGRSVIDRIPPEMHLEALEHMRRLKEERSPVPQREGKLLRMDGTRIDVELSAVPFFHEDEHGALVFARDITDRKRAEETQEKLNRALRLLSDCNMALVHAEREQSLLDEICRLVVTRGGYLMAWVCYPEQNEQKSVRPMSHFGRNEGYIESANVTWADNERGQGPIGRCVRTGKIQVNQNYLDNPAMAPWRESAARRGFRSSIALPLKIDQNMFGVLSIYSRDPESFAEDEVRLLEELATDLTFGISTLRVRIQREAAEEKLAFLAHYDPLTHLPNRVLLRDRFERAAARAARQHRRVAMLVLDLDNFKRVNDSLGHEVGDLLLLRVVERLKHCISEGDTISRQSGDEFVILLQDLYDTGAVGRIAQSILDAVSEPFEIGEHTISTSFSIGIGMYPGDGNDFDTLLKNTDAALYHAKDNGRDTYHFFANTMNVDALASMQLHSNLRKAVKNQEFLLHYQPQIDIGSGAIVGAEALVRWRGSDGALVAPGHFIPMAEESGLIVPIGEWVLNEACRQAKEWIDGGMAPLVVAVNLSAQQFRRGDIVDTVRRALAQSGLPPALLELELTESILLQDTAGVMETLHSLKKLGVLLSIDDFGTGYSSLAYLKKLAVDKLKIDQSFVRDLSVDADDEAIVKAVIQLGHALQLHVVAEGVETESQLAFLRKHGCDHAQGYLITRPLPAPDFQRFAEKSRSA
ncbi:MAG TPA: EAL domain-containing protein [Noviherbaspirillum sp.]|uniref:EAL domain-containing protein n=1 Tax=Noviherbaspirillum sp. TaxID=1926288 RepID=UPI002B4903D6|nr:EAL domain-containing protein [Noviherbaspirillum sp.]HJV87938.1 EAL domain-containing protein [Noviherbaspirillum sp.]